MGAEILYLDENLEKILGLTPAARLYLEAENSVTYQNALSEDGTLLNLFLRKSGLQLSLEHSNQLLPISNTSPENGKKIVLRNDCLEYHLPEYWTIR